MRVNWLFTDRGKSIEENWKWYFYKQLSGLLVGLIKLDSEVKCLKECHKEHRKGPYGIKIKIVF